MTGFDVDGYLRRLGLSHPGPPAVDALRRLHRAHVERIAYETVDIHLGRLGALDPTESADRLVRLGRGGYCLTLNSAFEALLSALGFQVERHLGSVVLNDRSAALGIDGHHMALTVRGLPTTDNPDGTWLVDVGLGDGPHAPLPLVAGVHRQGGFVYRLRTSPVAPEGWRLDHDRRGHFIAMDFLSRPAATAEFTAAHREMSTSEDSLFVRVFTAHRRTAADIDRLRGCVLTRVGSSITELRSAGEWLDALVGRLGIVLDDVSPRRRRELWERAYAVHLRWLAKRRDGRAESRGTSPSSLRP
ncbi:arylamine N-acetyltransferase [Actinoalloteichus hoggarensis]|uniref:N-hydroxyarylamine O-acetyltransferase n=1 Tax=Actinoalloteichus hoggarensis TaxID=1470176 RepID=A0A221W5E8_9PSEU|nr:arylamine N-acetyltransferase [Actinoalloteichus hoggarensis]ASO20911.1 N-hydroxyarylamine O-acetyltransferase [Actinoalloteichus hoggarensis]MBB5920841.1 arylamine N-acetyltransferase [Actinoalloteichus hoggarensis]